MSTAPVTERSYLLSNQIAFVPLTPIQEKPKGFSCWMGQKCRRFTRFGAQTLILALDILFAVGKFVSSTPPVMAQAALTALSFVGLVSLPYSLDFLAKTQKDTHLAYRWNNPTILVLSLSRSVELTSNIALTLLGCTASFEGLIGNLDTQDKLYNFTIIWGITTVALGTLNTLAAIFMNHRMLSYLSSEENNRDKEKILDAFKEDTPAHQKTPIQAAELRFCMDKDTLEKLLAELKLVDSQDSVTKENILAIIKANVQTQQRFNMGPQLALTLIGDALMATEKWYTPNSIQAAIINLTIAGAYTIKISAETVLEVLQRMRIERARIQAEPV